MGGSLTFSDSHLYKDGIGKQYWGPQILWSRERGWLLVQDPADGSWFSIPAKGAPSGWVRIANAAKQGESR